MKTRFFIFSLGLLLTSCAVMSNFDQNSYNNIAALKSQSLVLIGEANTPAATHAQEISNFQSSLSSAVAYENGKGISNRESNKQWEYMASPNHESITKFITQWQAATPFSPAYLTEKAVLVGAQWDELTRLEGAKPKN